MTGSLTRRRTRADDDVQQPARPRCRRPRRAAKSPATPSTVKRPGRGDRGAQRDQRGGVVEQRLPLEDRHDPARDADAPRDRGGRDGVRRGDDGTEREGGRPGDGRDHVVGHDRDADGGERHQADREQQDRPAVGVEVDQRGLQRRGVEQRREQPDEHHLLGQVHLGHEGQVRRAGPDRDEQQRSGQVEPAAGAGDHDDDGREGSEGERDVHLVIQPTGSKRGAAASGRLRRAARRPSASGRPSRGRRRRAWPAPAPRACGGARRTSARGRSSRRS